MHPDSFNYSQDIPSYCRPRLGGTWAYLKLFSESKRLIDIKFPDQVYEDIGTSVDSLLWQPRSMYVINKRISNLFYLFSLILLGTNFHFHVWPCINLRAGDSTYVKENYTHTVSKRFPVIPDKYGEILTTSNHSSSKIHEYKCVT